MCKREQSTGDGVFTLAFNPTQAESTKVRNREYQWVPKNGDVSPQKLEKKKKKQIPELILTRHGGWAISYFGYCYSALKQLFFSIILR